MDKKFSKNTIIVRTKNLGNTAPIGKMYRSCGRSWDDRVILKGGWAIKVDECRLATNEEIRFFNLGYKNIFEIPKHLKNVDYDIY